MKDLAYAMLPLGIWVTGAVAYERIAPPLLEATLVAPIKVAALTRSATLRDERSLIDIRPMEADAAQAMTAPVSTDSATGHLSALVSARTLAVAAGADNRLPIDIEAAHAIPKGAYLVVRGVPLDATLTHGVAIGPELWLVDGGDTNRVGLATKSGLLVSRELVLQLVSIDGRLLAEDRLLIEAQSIRLPEPRAAGSTPINAALQASAAVPMVILPRAADEPTQPEIAPQAQGAPRPQAIPVAAAKSVALAAAPEAAKPAGRTPAPATGPDKSAPVPASSKAIEAVLARGRRMLEMGNIAVARPLLERAATSGSAAAALLIASSYDPNWLSRKGTLGLSADATQARRWYAEARRLGSSEAAQPMAALGAE